MAQLEATGAGSRITVSETALPFPCKLIENEVLKRHLVNERAIEDEIIISQLIMSPVHFVLS